MTAGILTSDNMVYFGKKPWHNQGVEASPDERYDWKKFAGKANLLWTAQKVPLVTMDYAQKIIETSVKNGQPEDIVANTEAFATVRSDTNQVLGIVGNNYTVLQNEEAFSFFQSWLDTKEMALHTGGSLFNGRKLWVLAQFTKDPLIKIAGDDDVAKFVLLSSSHDGTTSVRFGTTLTRVVCANTLALAHKSGQLIKTTHTKQMKKNLDSIKSILDVANQEFIATAEQLKFLASKSINTKDLEQYVKIVLELDKVEEDKISTRSKNIMKNVLKFMDDPNQTMNGVSGTYYAAFNAYNSYLMHSYGRTESSRLDSMWFGLNKNKNQKALDIALKMAS